MIFSMPLCRSQMIRSKALGFTSVSQDMFAARTPLDLASRQLPTKPEASIAYERACSDYRIVMTK
jgi:hypothetical protein